MKNVLTLLVVAGLGAAGLWAFQRFSSEKPRQGAREGGVGAPRTVTDRVEASMPGEEGEEPARSAPPPRPHDGAPVQPGFEQPVASEPAAPPGMAPTLARRPLFSPPAAGRDLGGDPSARQEPLPEARLTRAAEAPGAAARPGEAARTAVHPASAIEDERGLARTAFDAGDRRRGTRLLEELYSSSRDRADVDLSPEVTRLLDVEMRLDRKREYIQYLARLDRTGRVLDDQLARAAKKAASADDSPEAATAAWDDLSLAYEAAADSVQRKKVMAQVEPFVQRMVFSGRYTPCLKSYTIQPGDSLYTIATKFQTTADSLRRLSGLKSDVIQPRQRLRILPGKLKILVDKSDFLLWATLDGRIFLEFPVGLGRDNATPVGTFVIRVRQKDPAWWRPGEQPIPAGDPRNILGARWLGFRETQDLAGFGIHGTEDPSSLGKESSSGCIRLRNEDIEVLFDFAPYGTEVVVRN